MTGPEGPKPLLRKRRAPGTPCEDRLGGIVSPCLPWIVFTMAEGLPRSVGWGSVAALFLAVLAIPLANRATVCTDDFVWITNAWSSGSLPEALSIAWSSNFFFRPIDILANRLINPRTLDVAPLLAWQIAGLLALTAGTWRLLALLGSSAAASRFIAAAWLWLHPATQLSVWSAGCSSQTWCAAFGVWTICRTLEFSLRRIGRRDLTILALLSAGGIIAKELFVGWAMAAAFVAVVGQPGFRRGQRLFTALKTAAPAACAVTLPSFAWIGARLWFTRFGDVMHDPSGGPYTLHGPAIVLINLGTSVLGMFVQGPVHWARLLGLPWMLVPLVGAALSGAFAFVGGTRVAGTIARLPNRLVLPMAVMIGVVAVWPALLIGKVSELYLMGPNALIAALVGMGVPSRRGSSTRGGRFAASILFLIALAGFVSRSYHFKVTWSQARDLRDQVRRIAEAVPPGSRLVIGIPETLQSGPMHSKYCVPPAVAAGLPQSWFIKRLADPSLPEVEFMTPIAGGDARGYTAILEAPSQRRGMW